MTDSITPNGHDTPSQLKANRKNAKLSTGPRTESGKARSAQNAFQHGLRARAILLPTEDPAAFQRHAQKFFDQYQPVNATEEQLVRGLAGASWHLNRIDGIETALFSPDSADLDLATQIRTLSALSMHRHRLSRQFERTLQQFREIQEERRRTEQHQLSDAASLLQMDQEKGVPFDPAANGFVCSKAEIETYIHRRRRAKKAARVARDRNYAEDLEDNEEQQPEEEDETEEDEQ
ncbi:MAG TPA: hypothetical protein VEU96_09315 [Bryobacteraceae bacterium]|nr:hypothetical protein [Bryobacteraceae bacterium]